MLTGVCVFITVRPLFKPRRVAAITVAKRVADERSGQLGDEVGYCVRFDEKMSGMILGSLVTERTKTLTRKIKRE